MPRHSGDRPELWALLGYALTDLLTARTYPLILSAFLLAGSLLAQTCPIDIGPDRRSAKDRIRHPQCASGFPELSVEHGLECYFDHGRHSGNILGAGELPERRIGHE